uniref:Protein S100-B n=2 Tax=Sus scrofa TaxID=9823 RepID=A0A8W4FCZ9_PIG
MSAESASDPGRWRQRLREYKAPGCGPASGPTCWPQSRRRRPFSSSRAQESKRHEAGGPGMSELEKAVVALIDVFHQYSGREGDKHKLKKSELKELINSELSHFLEEIKEQEVVDKVMETLDSDGDGECDFQEFMAFVAMVTTACHEFFEHE